MAESENVVLYDWLTFSSQSHSPEDIMQALGLDDRPWVPGRGMYGYKSALIFGHIMIWFDGSEGMGVCCSMSGQGCREFDSFSKRSWEDLFCWIIGTGCKVTRLDVAYDDHAGILPLDDICRDVLDTNYVSYSQSWDVHKSDKGTSCSIGSGSSKVYIRIYDKAAERKLENEHWIRVEIQMRDDRAKQFIQLEDLTIGQSFSGVLLNYLRFVHQPIESDDTNKRRWPMADYWKKLIGDASRISIYTAPGVDYNLEGLTNNVINRWGNPIEAFIRVYGLRNLWQMLEERDRQLPAKYQKIVDEFMEYARIHELDIPEPVQLGFESVSEEQLGRNYNDILAALAADKVSKAFHIQNDFSS